MPLTTKGSEILSNMEREYGAERGERVFYASKNAGKISGIDSAKLDAMVAAVDRVCARVDAMERRRK